MYTEHHLHFLKTDCSSTLQCFPVWMLHQTPRLLSTLRSQAVPQMLSSDSHKKHNHKYLWFPVGPQFFLRPGSGRQIPPCSCPYTSQVLRLYTPCLRSPAKRPFSPERLSSPGVRLQTTNYNGELCMQMSPLLPQHGHLLLVHSPAVQLHPLWLTL